MPNIRDLMTPEDALEMEERFDAVLREYNEKEPVLSRVAARRDIFDYEKDLEEEFFDD